MTGRDPRRGVYAISVAAEMVGTNIQNLRVYERHGLVDPARTGGGSRLYSETDLVRIARIVDPQVLDVRADHLRGDRDGVDATSRVSAGHAPSDPGIPRA